MFGVLNSIREFFTRERVSRLQLQTGEAVIATSAAINDPEFEDNVAALKRALTAIPKRKPRKGCRWCKNLDGSWSQVKIPKSDPAAVKRTSKRRRAA